MDVRAGDLAPTLKSGGDSSGNKAMAVAFHLTQDPISGAVAPAMSTGTKTGCATVGVAISFQERGREGGPSLEFVEEEAYCLTAPSGGSRAQEKNVAIAFQEGRDEGRGLQTSEDQAYALRAGQGGGRRDANTVLLPQLVVRRLTPRECERLQGFPDDHTLIEWPNARLAPADLEEFRLYLEESWGRAVSVAEAKRLAPDSPRYRAIGNSMAVNVMRWIGRRIDSAVKHERENS
jgi:DNA (cytosine-5)-methyltransferase 1